MRDLFAHRRARAHLDARFVGETPHHAAAVRLHLDACETCQAYFERLAAADRAVSGDLESPGPFERGFMRDCVLGGADSVALASGRRRAVVAGLLAASVVAAVGVVALRPTAAPENALDLRPRGGAPAVHQVELVCFEPAMRAAGSAPSAAAALQCPATAELRVAAMNTAGPASPLPYLTLVSVAADGTAHRLLPVDPVPGSLSMHIGELPRVTGLGVGLRLSVNHRPGAYRVHALFTEAPVGPDALDAHLEGKAPGVRSEHALVVLPQ